MHPRKPKRDFAVLNQEQRARAWETFYALSPHRVAKAPQETLVFLPTLTGSGQARPAADF